MGETNAEIVARIEALIVSLDRICPACLAATSDAISEMLHAGKSCPRVRTRPPRTGFRDDAGVYHPAPDGRDFDRHADVCEPCSVERSHPRIERVSEVASMTDKPNMLAQVAVAIAGLGDVRVTAIDSVNGKLTIERAPMSRPMISRQLAGRVNAEWARRNPRPSKLERRIARRPK